MNNQVKSKERVSDFGEVNTSEREVNAMLDLVKQETERLDSRFLEPACGDGNFLIEVLSRKLRILTKRFKKNQYEFEKNSVVVMGSIYGIDIQKDNVQSARDRLFDEYYSVYMNHFKNNPNQKLIKSIRFIVDQNIIHGDALTLEEETGKKPLTFCEWAVINTKLKRRDFTLSDLLAYSPFERGTLFSDLGEEVNIPKPKKEYPLVNFEKAYEAC
jgi:hypothetical protein